jgi:hypothetical protein
MDISSSSNAGTSAGRFRLHLCSTVGKAELRLGVRTTVTPPAKLVFKKPLRGNVFFSLPEPSFCFNGVRLSNEHKSQFGDTKFPILLQNSRS